MSNVTTKDELAKIAIAKNLIKEYKNSNSERTVYLNNGTEFQIYLKNPYPSHTGIKISVNDKPIGNMLVLRPGQSFWLDRFLNENKKFLFSTYEVENSKEMEYATSKNGKVTIQFYHEKEKPYVSAGIVRDINDVQLLDFEWNNGRSYTFNGVKTNVPTCSTYGSVSNSVNTVLTSSLNFNDASTFSTSAHGARTRSMTNISAEIDNKATKKLANQGTMETGRVEKGGVSSQQFDYCDLEFEYWPFQTEVIQILPVSRKQIRPEDTRRKYCSQCGKKVNPKDKFCSNCGAKLY
jgi:hypothetical protein